MPDKVSSLPLRTAATGRPCKYDWPMIFNGEIHRFTPDEVPGTLADFGRQVRAKARLQGKAVTVITRKGQGVFVQAEDHR